MNHRRPSWSKGVRPRHPFYPHPVRVAQELVAERTTDYIGRQWCDSRLPLLVRNRLWGVRPPAGRPAGRSVFSRRRWWWSARAQVSGEICVYNPRSARLQPLRASPPTAKGLLGGIFAKISQSQWLSTLRPPQALFDKIVLFTGSWSTQFS